MEDLSAFSARPRLAARRRRGGVAASRDKVGRNKPFVPTFHLRPCDADHIRYGISRSPEPRETDFALYCEPHLVERFHFLRIAIRSIASRYLLS